MAQEPRFDVPAILRASTIIALGTAALGLIIPVAGALIDGDGPLTTRNVSGNGIFQWGFWAAAWGLTIWQGAWMLRQVHDRIIDDMLVTSVVVAIVLLVVKFTIWIAYEPVNAEGVSLPPVTGVDAGGALMLFVVALIGARVNKY